MNAEPRALRPVLAALLLVAATPAHAASDQLELTPDIWVTGILLVAFIVVIFPLNSLIFQPLFRVMDERESRIDGARARANDVQRQAEDALARYETSVREAREAAVADRRQHVEVARAELLQTTRAAKEEAEQELERAREELQSSIDSARESLRQSAEELAQLSAERVLGRSLS